ncbi:hypothetical protein T484DRAFT_1849811 [Baffinella frigidus]|nr:hypothetical protein T484DRAFT_1849811 [Cryptophyta sp. CCMP2293]
MVGPERDEAVPRQLNGTAAAFGDSRDDEISAQSYALTASAGPRPNATPSNIWAPHVKAPSIRERPAPPPKGVSVSDAPSPAATPRENTAPLQPGPGGGELCGKAAPWVELARLAAGKKLRSKLHKLCGKAGCPAVPYQS